MDLGESIRKLIRAPTPGGESSGSHNRAIRLALFLLSAATLTFEINLTRMFSVAQFYHFAFMIVSVALLGYGASGSALALFPRLGRRQPGRSLGWLALATSITILGAYLLTNWLPFDSFSIAVDRRQVWILVLHYIALAAPFFFCGMAVALLLSAFPESAGGTYAVNLFGSALGCALALVAPPFLGGEGMVVLSSGLAALATIIVSFQSSLVRHLTVLRIACFVLLLFSLLDLGLRLAGQPLPLLDLRLSPYKSLSYALQSPGAQVVYRRWNAFSRVDVVRSASIHSIPGLSYRYLQPLPPQDGLLVDGDDLSAVLSPAVDLAFADYLPSAIAFQLRPQAGALILEPRGGLDVLTALTLGARDVTAVEVNPLIVEAAPVYADPRVRVVIESDRSYLRRASERYDVILLSLASSYHPVRSGAYALAEDYRYTVEAFQDALARLTPGGLLVVTRWLQDPPSEDLRAFALAVTAIENSGADPRTQIVAFRGYQTGTLLIRNGSFTDDELQSIRDFAASRAFDLTYAPGIRPEETNLYNVLAESVYYQNYTDLLDAPSREAFYAAYPFDVRPPTDDKPFFGHYFKWSQAPQVLAELGKTWQPFGGAGYFVILALLALAILLSTILILLPVAIRKPSRPGDPGSRHSPLVTRYSLLISRPFLYFALIGLAFLLVEIPLIQRFILYLGHPAYAMTVVLFTLLLFSALGSRLSEKIPLHPALFFLAVLLIGMPFLLSALFSLTLGLPLALRLALTALVLAPAGFLMGIPFPAGLRWATVVGRPSSVVGRPSSIPWVWAVNGAASVVAAVLAALLALTFGFSWVLRIGALCYAGAWLTVWAPELRSLSPRR